MTFEKEETITHPSFGFIRASRVTGDPGNLFDSVVRHRHFIEVEIGPAEQVRSPWCSRVHGASRGFITVRMSEAQFAAFITGLNVGSGTPCTIAMKDGKPIEPPAADKNTKESFREDVRERLQGMQQRASDALRKVEELLGRKGSPTKTDLATIKAALYAIEQDLRENLPFAQQVFEETTEKVVASAKVEIEAHVAMMAQKAGLRALELAGPEHDTYETEPANRPESL